MLAALVLTAGCKSKDNSKPPPAQADPTAERAPPAPRPDPSCLTATTIQTNHRPATGAGPCTQDTSKDFNRDGLADLVVWCGADEPSSTIYAQGPADCFIKIAELEVRWVLLDDEAPVNGFVPLAVIVHEGESDDEIEEETYVYDPGSRRYVESAAYHARSQDDGAGNAPTGVKR